MTGPLEGVRVIELGMYLFVPAATAALADWGADVVKVEHPLRGDPVRTLTSWGVEPDTHGVNFLLQAANRGKRSIGLDVGSPEGHDLLMRLIRDADVFATSFLPRARQRLGVDIADVHAVSPRIIYAIGSAHGLHGDEAGTGGFDGNTYWHRSGIGMALMDDGDTTPPNAVGPAFGDLQAGMNLAGGISAALVRRARTGEGAVVDSSLLGSGLWAMQATVTATSLTGQERLSRPRHGNPPNPLVNTYRTADDRFIALLFTQPDRYWSDLCAVLDRDDLAEDERFSTSSLRRANAAACVAELDDAFAALTLDEARARLSKQDGQWSVSRRASEASADPQARANGYVQTIAPNGSTPVELVPAPVQFDQQAPTLRRAPELGEHTEALLLEAGMDWDTIIALKNAGAIS